MNYVLLGLFLVALVAFVGMMSAASRRRRADAWDNGTVVQMLISDVSGPDGGTFQQYLVRVAVPGDDGHRQYHVDKRLYESVKVGDRLVKRAGNAAPERP